MDGGAAPRRRSTKLTAARSFHAGYGVVTEEEFDRVVDPAKMVKSYLGLTSSGKSKFPTHKKRKEGNQYGKHDQARNSVPLHRIIAVDLRRALSAEPSASRSKYCSGSRCLGRWFWLEERLRHSCQGWLQRQHRSRAGDVL